MCNQAGAQQMVRYGETPNRLQHYYQFQVVMKPSPANFQELYVDSLKALGVDTLEHDVRFVEDNWESPTLGAWGLGWEVWLNGMEVSQFTYFQQAGGIECFPVTGEITYGLERIAMYLQSVESVYDLVWAETPRGHGLPMVMCSIKTRWKCRRTTFKRRISINYLPTSTFTNARRSDSPIKNYPYPPMNW